jgi:uncharacterized cupredoxin-like copper-binding protein
MKMRMWFVAVALALPLVACGGGSSPSVKADRTIEMTTRDNKFEPDVASVRRGEKIAFRFRNQGKVNHEAFVGTEAAQQEHESKMKDMGGMDMHDEGTISVKPGETKTLVHTFPDPGTLLIGCHEPGHWQAGMKVVVTVD